LKGLEKNQGGAIAGSGISFKFEQISYRNILKSWVPAVRTTLDESPVGSRIGTAGAHPGFREPQPRSEPAMKSIIKSFFKDESGATAIEYGLIAAGIAIAIITAVNGLGDKLSTNFVSISTSLK
jgi:pilus assembly protein Flp/PilA